MPIIGNSDQSRRTLIEFYQELLGENNSFSSKNIGATMLNFIEMVNSTFKSTTLYGLTSHYNLIIQSEDSWKSQWYIRVYCFGDGKIQFEYKMPNIISPWEDAFVKGQANTIEEAKNYLIIAMTECGGWEDNEELRKLYNEHKKISTETPSFKLWLEFEEVDPNNWDIENEFCNIGVQLSDGRHYGINVWTYKFLETAINSDSQTGDSLNGLYQKPPDLFVRELTRNCIELTIQDLLKQGDLEQVLNPTILSKREKDADTE
jgi:hypothetical protein